MGLLVIHPIYSLIPPFLLFPPAEWMSGLKTHNLLCQTITVQNYRPPVAQFCIQAVSLQFQQPTPNITITTSGFSAMQLPKKSIDNYRNKEIAVKLNCFSSAAFLMLGWPILSFVIIVLAWLVYLQGLGNFRQLTAEKAKCSTTIETLSYILFKSK